MGKPQLDKPQQQTSDAEGGPVDQRRDEQPHYARPTTVPWPPLLLAGAIIGAVACGQLVPLTWPGLDDGAARIIGWSIGGGGVLLLLWSAWTLRQFRTTILPHQGADTLVVSGPYWRFRNPIYLADVMLLLGVAELTKNIWFVIAALAFAGLVTWLAIIPEERHLEARFGDDYRAYKARSRRWI